MHPAALEPDRLLRDCRIERTRASGPGGQHRNKVETAIRLIHEPTGITAMASERRSQERNRAAAVFRLRVNLALAVRESWFTPSDLWASRCRKGRIAINSTHDDFPVMLAEALDALASHDHDASAGARALGCSATQIVKLLKVEPRALILVNQSRQAKGQHKLR